MFTQLSPEAMQELGSFSLFPVMEFTIISALTIVMYLGIHSALTRLHPATKVLVSMFFGTIAYSIGKIAVITFFVGSTAQAVAY